MARKYVEDVRRKVRRAMERLRAEGRLYTKPSLVHWIALYRSNKKSFKELTREDIEEARRYFETKYVELARNWVPIRRVWRRFIESEVQVIQMIKRYRENMIEMARKTGGREPKHVETYTSYSSFYRTVVKLLGDRYSAGGAVLAS